MHVVIKAARAVLPSPPEVPSENDVEEDQIYLNGSVTCANSIVIQRICVKVFSVWSENLRILPRKPGSPSDVLSHKAELQHAMA